MRPFVWKEGMSTEETKNGAYWERNMLAVMIAVIANESWADDPRRIDCGWYKHGEWPGWSRVVSLFNGQITFHVPDDFDIGEKLPKIEPNWDGHSTADKWEKVMRWCGMPPDGEDGDAARQHP